MSWLIVVLIVVVPALLAWAVTHFGAAPPPRAPGPPVQRPSSHWPQAVYVRHDVHHWHHVVDDRHPLAGPVVDGVIEQGEPRALPPTEEWES